MDQRFYLVKAVRGNGAVLCEVYDGKLFILNGSLRTGIALIKKDPTLELRKFGASHFKTEVSVEDVGDKIGAFYPSVARPLYNDQTSFINVQFEKQIHSARRFEREIGVLVNEIEECFDVVSFEKENFNAFGFVFQNIIHLSCIGSESLFVKVLEDNLSTRKRHTFAEFKRLNCELKLSDYSIDFPKYPWIPAFSPFSVWSKSGGSTPTWQQANNQLKHAKESGFKTASLYNAVDSVCAFAVLFVAVFGDDVFDSEFEGNLGYFRFAKRPVWSLSESYFFSPEGKWVPRPLTSVSEL